MKEAHLPEINLKSDGTLSYDNGLVTAVIEDHQDGCVILEFCSRFPGQGNAKRTLNCLKDTYGPLIVVDPGTEEYAPESFNFWRHIVRSGLVKMMLDTQRNLLYKEGEWLKEAIDETAYPALFAELT
ncbi:hypothetical protein QO002_001183 [Pararhizobium capsulatum DSM 1112]|uniref:Uncharacterized protein n=1 Tax=Pararhizobium capsulatum DSM 1112 TaxID=1121113 RepID=A0ABU0BLC7_9HYPH|nr:hypothetical protein [Pararhizobium capsulatum]MDQ0319045.1 hypothetical protein [Pararhizobium capsulatum DSM 1112]